MLRLVCVVIVSTVAVASPVSSSNGKWIPEKYGEAGRYNRPRDEGKYVHIPYPYIHIDNPYDGGYGPYAHQYEPYEGAESVDQYRLVLQPGDDNPFYKEGYYRNNGIKIISQNHNYHEDKYDFDFETENKIRAEEKAILKNPNSIDEGIASEGFYEYIGPDGFMYRVDYTADENGFRPKVKRLETPYSGKWIREKINNY
ncbi:uncharacterized protein LOC134647293 isoform X2 [Cydia amplana]|uniref:uncharacterized protein LOC134647291 isoform X3 n=1 Tax=Cydia amplana TaxID=1869771 RepID=UPI002FE69CF7